MFCPHCGTQTEAQPKFCKLCGHKLVEHARLLKTPEELEQNNGRERLLRKGAGALIGSFLLTAIYLITSFLALSRKPSLLQTTSPAIWLLIMFAVLLPGFIGILNLARGGYFKNFREQQLQDELERLRERQKIQMAKQRGASELLSISATPMEAMSIVESTTRELSLPVSRIKGEQ